MEEPSVETDGTPHPDIVLEYNLLDILTTTLSRFPIPRNNRIACQTTARPARRLLSKSKGEQELSEEENLESQKMIGLHYYPKLLDRTVELASLLLNDIVLNKANFLDVVFMTYISPELTSSFYSPELFSEHDSCEYCNVALIRPALAAMHLLNNKGIPTSFKCTDSDTDLYVTSGFKRKDSPIADYLLIKGPYKEVKYCVLARDNTTEEVETEEDEDEEQLEEAKESDPEELDEDGKYDEDLDDSLLLGISPKVLMTMEMKTSTALTDRTFSDVLRFRELERFTSSYIMRFVWPNVKGQNIKKCSKALAQVYEQMYHNDKTEYAWLSSYDVNIFFFLDRDTRIMYMSEQYDRETMTPMLVFAWFCRANGLINEDLVLPARDDTFFDRDDTENPNEAGLISVPMYKELSEELPDPPITPRRTKRSRGDATQDILGDNEATPTQSDFVRGRKKRKNNSKSNVD